MDEFDAAVYGRPTFEDRREAGRLLGHLLANDPPDVVVGLTRGGVEVAGEVSAALAIPLEVVVVKKIAHPLEPECAIGAVTADGDVFVDAPGLLSADDLADATRAARARAHVLTSRLRLGPPEIAGKSVALVDDGMATGSTMIAAARWAHRQDAARVVVAVPVASVEAVEAVRREVDCVVCPHELQPFGAVGLWYEHFAPLGDAAVEDLLRLSREVLVQAGR